MADPGPEESVFQQLNKAGQRFAKAFAEKPIGTPGATPSLTTEAELLKERYLAAEEALAIDIVALAQNARERAGGRILELAKRLRELQTERRDVHRRRNELDEAARGYDWSIVHLERRDFLGPFSIEHSEETTTIELTRSKRTKLAFPSGREVFEAVQAVRAELDKQVDEVWADMKKRIVPLQATPDTLLLWPEVVAALSTPELPFKRREAAVLYVLAQLRSGRMPDGWSASFKQPTLAQQNDKDAVTLPRIDRPGNPDRIAALRLNSP